MGKIVRTIHVAHGNKQILGGLLHYILAASNHTAKAYRKGVRGKELYGMAVHRTDVYQSRFADYIILDICGSHKVWRTRQLSDLHARAPHYHNPVAQTDQFELAFDHASKRWNGAPAIHVAIYGRGRPGQPWMAFEVPPYMVERLSKPHIKPKTIRIDRDRIYVTYEKHVPDREPVDWAGVDMNAGNNPYARADGRVMVVPNDHVRQYNRACSRILRVKRRGDRRVMKKFQARGWKKYTDCIRDSTRKEARRIASAGYGLGYEELNIHRLYTKNGRMASFVRGRQKTTLNTGQRRRALINAVESEGLPHVGVDPGRYVHKLSKVRRKVEALRCTVCPKRTQHVVPVVPYDTGAGRKRRRQHFVPYHMAIVGGCRPARQCRTAKRYAAGHIGAAGGCRRQCRFRGTA